MYTKDDILKQLADMDAPRSGILVMHSSLRSVGEVLGGGEALLDAMIEYFAEDGLFCVPTHTWANLGTDKITLDMSICESNLGAFPRIALRDGRGIRSENPTHSMVVFGGRERASELIRGEAEAMTPTSVHGIYGEIFNTGGHIMLVGVGQDKNTYLHFVDELFSTPARMSDTPERVTVRLSNGEIIEREIRMYDERCGDISELFPKYEPAFRAHGCIKDGYVGDARTQLCDARGMAEVIRLMMGRAECDLLRDVDVIPPEWYM